MQWDGEVLRPTSSFWAGRADQDYVVGEVYEIEPVEERSMASHRHMFAVLKEGWRNLPESVSAQFPTVDALRARLLIQTGYRDQTSIVCGSNAVAERVASFGRSLDPYAVVIVHGSTVIHMKAQSQSIRAMGKKRFQESKEAILGLLATIIEVGPEALEQATEEGEQ